MLKKMPKDDEEPRQKSAPSPTEGKIASPVSWLRDILKPKAANSSQLKQELENYIEELDSGTENSPSAENQQTILANVLKTRDLRVSDIMVPRADIIAIDQDATQDDLKNLFRQYQFSRLPVHKGGLDEVVGILHIKDLLSCLLEGRDCRITDLVREATIVTPGLPLMDLFHTMREEKKPMALVLDEHGGIDGLVTINDIVEAITGDIDDEFDREDAPQVIEKADGSLVVDARMDIEDFEEKYGEFLTEEEREDVETLGGLAFYLAGRVPKRGEVLTHDSGITLEVLEGNKSRVGKLRIKGIKPKDYQDLP
jgi:CBS domain containing-hemolysin-like protein